MAGSLYRCFGIISDVIQLKAGAVRAATTVLKTESFTAGNEKVDSVVDEFSSFEHNFERFLNFTKSKADIL